LKEEEVQKEGEVPSEEETGFKKMINSLQQKSTIHHKEEVVVVQEIN
jgi:hypothetical protein